MMKISTQMRRSGRRGPRTAALVTALLLSLGLAGEAQAQFNGNGLYRIRSFVNARQLDIDSTWFRGHLQGQRLILWENNGGANQEFLFLEDPLQPGTFTIRPRHTGMCLHVPGFDTADGATIDQWPCLGGDNQRFRVVPAGDPGYYQIQATHTASAFHVGDINGTSSPDMGAPVVLKRFTSGCPDQRMLFSFTRA